jgi:hypothetical protein
VGNHAGRTRDGRSNPLLTLTSAVVLAATLLLGSVAPVHAQSLKGQAPAAQPPTPQWQIDAGGKMEFDFASVKLDTAVPKPDKGPVDIPVVDHIEEPSAN